MNLTWTVPRFSSFLMIGSSWMSMFALLLVSSGRAADVEQEAVVQDPPECDMDCQTLYTIPVKRLHSRHRRFLAPGARWDVLLGFEFITELLDVKYYQVFRYELDYLYGGWPAFEAELAARNNTFFSEMAIKQQILDRATAAQILANRAKRSEPDEKRDNILIRTLADDQAAIFEKMVETLDKFGLSGQDCLKRLICELAKSDIHNQSILLRLLRTFFLPKRDKHLFLDKYRAAEEIGLQGGQCWAQFAGCPLSMMNLIAEVIMEATQEEILMDMDMDTSYGRQDAN